MNRCLFLFFCMSHKLSIVNQNQQHGRLSPWSSCLRPCSSSALRSNPDQLGRNSRDYRWKPVRKTQRRGRIFLFRRKPKQTAGAPLSLWRFYCDREQTRGIDFRNKLAYSLICDFLIQQFGFLNIWSGFIVVVVFLFFFSVLGSQWYAKSWLCRHVSSLSSSHWFPAWKTNICYQTKKYITVDNGDSRRHKLFQFTVDLKWHPVGMQTAGFTQAGNSCVYIQIPVCQASRKLQRFLFFYSYNESLWFYSVVRVHIGSWPTGGRWIVGWAGREAKPPAFMYWHNSYNLFYSPPLLHVSTPVCDCDFYLLFDSVARLDFNHYVWEERSERGGGGVRVKILSLLRRRARLACQTVSVQ